MPDSTGFRNASQRGSPGRGLGVGLAHQVADPLGLDRLAGLEQAVGAPPEPADRVAQLLPDDPLPDQLVGELDVGQEVVVEEVAERPVPHVVEEPRHAEELLDERRGRRVAGRPPRREGQSCCAKRPATCIAPSAWGNRLCSAVGKTQRADWSCGIRRRRCTHGRVDQVLLGRLARDEPVGPRVEEIPVDRIDDEALAAVGLGAGHVLYTSPTWLRSPSMRL